MSSGRPTIVGEDSGPQPPYPLKMEGKVISGFGRGSKELGIPTANLPVDEATSWIADVKSGVYFGYASLLLPAPKEGDPEPADRSYKIFPMVMSIGYNPFYKNTVRSAEVHVLHKFDSDFYGTQMRLLILGFVRNELDYTTLEALIKDINMDCDVTRNSLSREKWAPQKGKVVDIDTDGTLDAEWLVRP